jgi:hypothetical protein
MVHKQRKKREMAFQVYIRYPLFHQKIPMRLGEQRKYRIDAEADLSGIAKHPLFKLVKGEAYIKREPATRLGIKERRTLEKMGLGKQSFKRGLLESLSAD